MSKRDYYEILEVEREASDGQIKSAYRKLALKYHPDRNPGDHEAEERFKEAAEAYAVLADKEKRALYDRFGHQGVSSAGRRGRLRSRPSSRISPTSSPGSATSSASVTSSAGGEGAAAVRSEAPIFATTSRSRSRSRATGAETTIQIPREETCETLQRFRRRPRHAS